VLAGEVVGDPLAATTITSRARSKPLRER